MRSLFYAKSVSAMIASHSTRIRFWISSSNHPYEAAIKREAVSDFPFLAPTRGFEPPTYRLGGRRSAKKPERKGTFGALFSLSLSLSLTSLKSITQALFRPSRRFSSPAFLLCRLYQPDGGSISKALHFCKRYPRILFLLLVI